MVGIIVLAFAALSSAEAGARAGSIYGRVYDSASGDRLTGASVLVMGTVKGASTDLDGKYTIEGLDPGEYDVRISFMGYSTKVVTGVEVKGEESVKLDVNLEKIGTGDAFKIDDMVVSADRVKSTGAAVLAERRKSATIGDAISSEMISMSPDATSGDALKRVTGLSVVDDKFVFIRGVTDRYNETALNGVTVSSTDTDADKKSFSFDLIPASLISNTVVVKTATPDLPGDFSGGYVQVNTLEFPERRVLNLSVKGSYNELTTGEEILQSAGSDTDWRGVDDGSRDIPSGGLTGNALARALTNNWAPVTEDAGLNGSYQASFGDRFIFGENELGFIAAGTYKHKNQMSEFTESPSYRGTPIFDFEGTRYKRSVMWGGLLNLNYKIAGLHKFSLKTNVIQRGDDKVSYSEGMPIDGEIKRLTTIEWEERNLKLGSLSGEHLFPSLGDLELKWRVSASASRAEEPDRKHVEFEKGTTGDWWAFRDNYRTWAELDEDSKGFDTDITRPFGDLKVKAGFSYTVRQRDYSIDAWSTDPSSVRNPNYGLLTLPIDTVFSAEHYGPNMFTLIPVTVFTGEYDGKQTLKTGFGMIDVPFDVLGAGMRFAGGLRYEDSEQLVNTVKAIDDRDALATRVDKKDFLPSANLTWMAGDRINLRLAYYQSVNRPEFRELANVLYYDFDRFQNVKGNPNLRRAFIRNYDIRVEVFPDIGEVLAASFFYKTLSDAIEERLVPTPERYMLTWFNSPRGKNYGFELEARKRFGFIGDYFDNFMLTGNYTWVDSEIEYTEVKTDAEGNPVRTDKTRVMQGQSPWTINFSFLFTEPSLGTGFSVLYNRIGRRLAAVGDERDQDVYEEGRDMVDMAITQRFMSHLKIKFAVKNLLDEEETYTSGPEEALHERIRTGTTYELSLSYDF